MADDVSACSVLIPAFNAASTLDSALRSVQRQSARDWECIVVDDGSTDDTAAIAAQFASAEQRFTVVSIPHCGLIHALNTGLDYCRAPLIARMDADDLMHRCRLEDQMAVLAADRTLSAVGCHVRIFPRRSMSPRLHAYEEWLNGLTTADEIVRDAFVECPVAHPSLIMRRHMAALRYEDHAWPEDYDLMLRAMAKGLRVGNVPRRLLMWRDRPDRSSRSDARYSVENFTRCKAHYLASGYLASRDQYVLWGYGDTGRQLRNALARLGKHPSHIIEVKRTRIGQRIHGAAVVPVEELARLRGHPIVVSVARARPRAEVRAALLGAGFCEGNDFVCAA